MYLSLDLLPLKRTSSSSTKYYYSCASQARTKRRENIMLRAKSATKTHGKLLSTSKATQKRKIYKTSQQWTRKQKLEKIKRKIMD